MVETFSDDEKENIQSAENDENEHQDESSTACWTSASDETDKLVILPPKETSPLTPRTTRPSLEKASSIRTPDMPGFEHLLISPTRLNIRSDASSSGVSPSDSEYISSEHKDELLGK